jgi:toxin CcdB
LQSDLFDLHATRLVMPLVRMTLDPARMPRRLAQAVEVQGERLYPGAHLCAPLPARLLKEPVTSVRDFAHVVLDAVLSGV